MTDDTPAHRVEERATRKSGEQIVRETVLNRAARCGRGAPFAAAALATGLLFATGCAGLQKERIYAEPRVESPLRASTWGWYLPNRIFDIFDMVALGIQVGPGLNIRAQVTKFMGICFPTNSCGPEIGLNTYYETPIKPADDRYFVRRYRPVGKGCQGTDTVPFPVFNFRGNPLEMSRDQIDVGLHLILIGAHVGIRPMEIFDFVTGFVLVDLNHDDLTVKKAEDEAKKPDDVEEDE